MPQLTRGVASTCLQKDLLTQGQFTSKILGLQEIPSWMHDIPLEELTVHVTL